MVLVDTSIWIAAFRKPPRLRLEDIVDFDEIVTCLPVVQEILQGFREESAFQIAKEAMLSFPIVENPLEDDVFIEAVELYRSARHQGLTIRSSVDCLIAACALRNNLEVVHRDRDFLSLAEVSPLKVRSL